VELDLSPGPANPKKAKHRLWIDLERGANPLRVERFTRPPDLAARSHSIVLESFPAPGGKRIWLPIAGVHDSFLRDRKYAKEPNWRDTCKVVRSSILLNRGLLDRSFSVQPKDSRKSSAGLIMKREFDDLLAKTPARERTDQKSVEDRLQKQLEAAESQSTMLEAPSPARMYWTPVLITQIGLLGVGAALILWIVRIRR